MRERSNNKNKKRGELCSNCDDTKAAHRIENWKTIEDFKIRAKQKKAMQRELDDDDDDDISAPTADDDDSKVVFLKDQIVGIIVWDSTCPDDTRIARVKIIEQTTSDTLKVKHECNIRVEELELEWGQVCRGSVSSKSGPNDTFEVLPDGDPYWQPSRRIQAGTWRCACGKGARVAVNWTTATGETVVRCGTVQDLQGERYAIRFDNSDDNDSLDLHPGNMLPEARPEYKPGKTLMLLPPDRMKFSLSTAAEAWVEGEVVRSLGPENGSRHQVQLRPGGEEIELDLNRFNHTPQRLSSVEEFLRLRESYCQHLVNTRSQVYDTMTGRFLNVEEQTVNIHVENIQGPDPDPDPDPDPRETKHEAAGPSRVNLEYQNRTMLSMVPPVAASRFQDRSHGLCRAPSTVIRADAGTGKTWGMQQLEYALAKEAVFETLPLLICGQDLSNFMRQAGHAPILKSSRGYREETRTDGGALLRDLVAQRFSGPTQTMMLQSLELQAVVVLFDGVDEVLELTEPLQALFADDMLAKRYPFIVTSRPTGIEKIERFGGDCQAWDLLPLRDEQIMTAMRHQLGNNEFFVHLFAFKKLREAQDKLYYDELAPKSAIRKQVEELGGNLDRFRLPGGGYDPEMRQKTLDGDWLSGGLRSVEVLRSANIPKFLITSFPSPHDRRVVLTALCPRLPLF